MATGTIPAGVQPISRGGTGATTADSAKENLGLGGLKCQTMSWANGTSKTLTFPNTCAGAIITSGASTYSHDITTFHCSSSGNITYVRLRGATGLNVTTGTNTITFENTTSAYCYATVLYY